MSAIGLQSRKCPDCGGIEFVEDHAAGDVVCRGCGLVVEAHLMDERSEWRTFSDTDKAGDDPNRVGQAVNPLLEGSGLTTSIGKAANGDATYQYSLTKAAMRTSNPDRAILQAFTKISELCEQLHVADSVKVSAQEVYRNVAKGGALRGRNMMAICAACLYLAGRNNGSARTFKEICAILPNEVTKKDIGRAYKEIDQWYKKLQQEDPDAAAAIISASAKTVNHPRDYVRRFCNKLKLRLQVIKACEDMAMKAKPEHNREVKPWDGRSPISIAAAIIWIVTQLSQDKADRVNISDICIVTSVSAATIQVAQRDMQPELASLLPDGWCSDKDSGRLAAGLAE